MPKTEDFRLAVLVGGVPVPEYQKDGQCYVECNLFTPYSYQSHTCETVAGGPEEQVSWKICWALKQNKTNCKIIYDKIEKTSVLSTVILSHCTALI